MPRATSEPALLREPAAAWSRLVTDAPPMHALVYSVHDGAAAPRLPREAAQLVRTRFASERDWGANRVASSLAKALGLSGLWRMRVARSLLDFGRLRGVTTVGADHYQRRALAPDLGELLGPKLIDEMLALYDQAESDLLARITALTANPTPLLLVGVHTFDPLGGDGRGGPPRPRPAVSLLHVPQTLSPDTYGAEFAAALAGSTAHPALLDLLQAELAAAGFAAPRNEPYQLPEGSVELRHLAHLHHRGAQRANALVLEVRKDLVFAGQMVDGTFCPATPRQERPEATDIALAVGRAARRFAALAVEWSWPRGAG